MADVIGKMRSRIKIAVLQSTRDPKFGGQQKSYVLSAPIWARVEHKATGTDEAFNANQNRPDERVLFTIRFREVAYTSQIEYRGRRYEIEGVIPDEQRAYTVIETKYKGDE